MKTQDSSLERLTLFQLVLLILSIVVLAALLIDTVAPISEEVSRIIQVFDAVVCVFLLVDFGARFWRAENRKAFMKWGWIDLLASIPLIDFLRVGRLFRVVRLIRILRGMRAGQRIVHLVLSNKPRSAFASVGLSTILLVTFASVTVLMAERGPDANIRTAEDALWWSVTTVTTVGYGDRYPTTTVGRVIAMALMVCGVGLFGTFSGLMASFVLGDRQQENADLQVIMKKLEALQNQFASGDAIGGEEPSKSQPGG